MSSVAAALMLLPVTARARPSAEQIKILNPSEEYATWPFYKNFSEFARQRNIAIDGKDIVSTFPNIGLGLGSVVKIWRVPKYTVVDETQNITARSWGTSVNEILTDNNIELGEQDAILPEKSALPPADGTIKITRVKETEITETETIQFSTVEKKDAELERGKTRVAQTGKSGKKEKVYLVRRENGKEVLRQLISNKVVEAPVNNIVYTGTKILVLSSETGEASWTWGATASRRYKKGTLIRIINLSNGKSVETRVGGWGPMPFTRRILDLNSASWEAISGGGLGSGTMQVKVEELNE